MPIESMWPGWKAKFLACNAATLEPERAQAILNEFLRKHPWAQEGPEGEPHASEKGQEQGDGFV